MLKWQDTFGAHATLLSLVTSPNFEFSGLYLLPIGAYRLPTIYYKGLVLCDATLLYNNFPCPIYLPLGEEYNRPKRSSKFDWNNQGDEKNLAESTEVRNDPGSKQHRVELIRFISVQVYGNRITISILYTSCFGYSYLHWNITFQLT